MLIKRVKFSDISTTVSAVATIGRIRFYDKEGAKINFGRIISNSGNLKFETEIAYLDSMARYSETFYDALNDGYYSMINDKYDARINMQIVFKDPVTISKFELDTAGRYAVQSNLKVEFYNTNDELVKTYIINPTEYEFFNKDSLRLITIPTPELADDQKYFILNEKKANGVTKSFTIENKEVSAIPLFFEKEFNNEINSVDAYKAYSAEYPIEHVFKNNSIGDYGCFYASVDNSSLQFAHPSIKIEFKKPRLINAVEIQSKAKINAHITFEGYDEINKEWNLLFEYKAILINDFGKLRKEFDNSQFYCLYKITFLNLNNTNVQINDIKLIEYQSYIKEISASSPEDYKEYGMKNGEYHCTSQVLKKVVQKEKNKYGNGNVFSKVFTDKKKEIKSITI
ncbi:hypothetical protein M5X02_19705 [Paenibacillus alvei]|uniref:hypothetical protein n=1 Tax=Paenibacillus alvei TaxID=44250 RepID=UPI00228444DC|nr:hypothetical protein [Paenibacillus alvei]MCY9542876.1 hypothetical protein [Paenibacillus alvei]